MKFKYTALNPDNKQTTGVLDAPDVERAKAELHQMNLSILVINKISDEDYEKGSGEEEKIKTETGITTYVFKAKDPYQKIIEGTIDAKDIYSAFKRLITSYHFQVTGLYSKEQEDLADDILETNFQADKAQWGNQLKEEGINIEKALRAEPVNRDLEGDNEVLNQKMVEEIDQFIIKAKGVLKVHSDSFSVAFLEEIKFKIANLERIRSSNNIENITKISNELYELLSHPDRFTEMSEERQTDYKQGLLLIENNELVQKQHKVEEKARALSMMKGGFDSVLGKMKQMKPSLSHQETGSVNDWRFLVKSFWLYLKAPRGPLKNARYEAFKNAMDKRSAKVKEEKKERTVWFKDFWNKNIDRDYDLFFTELNGFIGLLLAFYVAYLFMVGLSLEKSLGLPEDFVLKTMEGSLIVNITLFLLWTHLALKIKVNLFHRQFLGSLFLFLFSGVVYSMVVVNF